MWTWIESLLPLRGRWLRYFLVGMGVPLFLCVAWYWSMLKDALPWLAVADPQYVHLEFTRAWGFTAGGGLCLCCCGYHVHFGPLLLRWTVSNGAWSWGAPAVAHLMDLSAVLAVVLMLRGVLGFLRKGEAGEDASPCCPRPGELLQGR